MSWKKEVKSWGIILGIGALLYFTGWMTPIVGGLQSIVLATGFVKPDTKEAGPVSPAFDYQGIFTSLEGNSIELKNYKGKTLFINLWATWCPPCRAEMAHIEKLYKKVKHQEDLVFLMIALDENFEKSKKFVSSKKFTFPVLHASQGLNRSLQSQAIPTTLVVNPSGEIVFYHEGMSNFNTEEFENFLLGIASAGQKNRCEKLYS